MVTCGLAEVLVEVLASAQALHLLLVLPLQQVALRGRTVHTPDEPERRCCRLQVLPQAREASVSPRHLWGEAAAAEVQRRALVWCRWKL